MSAQPLNHASPPYVFQPAAQVGRQPPPAQQLPQQHPAAQVGSLPPALQPAHQGVPTVGNNSVVWNNDMNSGVELLDLIKACQSQSSACSTDKSAIMALRKC